MDPRTCDSDLASYTEFLREEEEERLVEHAKSLTAAMATAHADAEARNQEIYEQSDRFKIVWSGSGRLSWRALLNVQQRQAPYCISPARR